MFHSAGPTFRELAEQCLSSTERGYDLLAPKFDHTPFRTPDVILDGLAKYLGPPRSVDAALDVCCGTGAAIRILRPLVRLPADRENLGGRESEGHETEPNGPECHGPECHGPECHGPERHGGRSRQRVVGIDFSQGMLDVARQHYPFYTGEPPVEFVKGDVLEMAFQEEFDLAVTVGSLGHILPRDEPRFVERVAAALKPGGRFAFVTAEMPPWWSLRYLLSRGFNAAMHVRNTIKRPPFIMFYLTFLLPRAVELLESHGFDVTVHDDAFSGRLVPLRVVTGTKRRRQTTCI
jgi:ubiquinone/menaquinone biosynthesis C-methylase UbiE